MIKVVSTALFGDSAYDEYLLAFVAAHHNVFPLDGGWRLRLHVDRATLARQAEIFARLAGLVDVRVMENAPLTKAMLWRLQPVFDEDVDYVFCRDIDACPMPRDRACAEQFIASGATVHTIHDSPYHVGIMGGLCGFRATEFHRSTGLKSLDDLYRAAGDVDWSRHGTDQDVLNRLLLRSGGPVLFEHRYAGWHAGPGKMPAREAGEYLCEAWSTPVPDLGANVFPGVLSSHARLLADFADRLGNHLGCAGYDQEEAFWFWTDDEFGDPDVAQLVKECWR